MEKPGALTRKEREKKFRVDFVLDAAFQIFSDKAFVNVSVEEIAAAAEMSVGTLYSLFETKGEIYRALVSREQTAFYNHINARIDAAPDARSKVHASIIASFEAFLEQAKGWQMYATAKAGLELGTRRQLMKEARAISESTSERIVRACEEGIARGAFKAGVDAKLVAVAISMIPQGYIGYVFEHMEIDIMSLAPSALQAADRIVGAD